MVSSTMRATYTNDAFLSSRFCLHSKNSCGKVRCMEISDEIRQHYKRIAKMGGEARSLKLTPARRRQIAEKAANARWAYHARVKWRNGDRLAGKGAQKK
jgi:hypothetical protein